MGEPALQPDLLTVAEYLAFEEKATTKHEYWDGHLRAMAGGSLEHAFLGHQLSRFFNDAMDNLPCFAAGDNIAVRIEENNAIVYPDVVIWCGDSELESEKQRILYNPIIVAEVLSPSTTPYDRGAKLKAYIQIPSLTDYLMLSPERVSIERYSRSDAGQWMYSLYVKRAEVIKFAKLGIELSVGDIYRKLNVPEGLRIVDLGNGQIAEATD